ncbi:transcription initiation factor TFIID subunit 9-like isoform X2 [Myxocyprinus asiaticus]|uniref:transcription initiation factor TFIID subunit 9-like isoform X2 n=1 Tax=Myxocyprinus asiaticus TaxID=70543 RepID=UPI0022237631|nr:transcription initiation factor TFIID subunit 9-like isoform X2 [Myxocyprinus asiaticus]
MASPKTVPKDAQVMIQILKDMGITEYEPRVINQMLEFTYRYVTTIIEDAKIYSTHAKKSNVDADDIRLAIQCRVDQSFTSPPPRDFLLEIARQKNLAPLPLIKPYTGPRLPPDRYCLTAPNYRLKSLQKKFSTTRVAKIGSTAKLSTHCRIWNNTPHGSRLQCEGCNLLIWVPRQKSTMKVPLFLLLTLRAFLKINVTLYNIHITFL